MRTKKHLIATSIYGAFALALLSPTTSGAQDGFDSVDVPEGQTAAQLQTLVAPIALYPDPLVAQILQAST